MNLRNLILLAALLLPGVSRANEILQEIVVSPGDTMWSIANRYLKDPQRWPEIVKYNTLPTSDPTIAIAGSKIKIPILLIKEEYRNAQLVRMIPEVRYKRRNASEWLEAKPDMILKYEDSLRTMKGGQARVLFPTREEVQINENSYVVLKPEKVLQEIQMIHGDIRASRAKVVMPGGAVVRPRGMSSDYQAKVREDKSSVVMVYRGEVDVTAQGQTVRVREGFGTQVMPSAPPTAPVPLPELKDFNPTELVAAAAPVLPQAARVISARPRAVESEGPPRAAPAGRSKAVVSEYIMDSYRIQLAANAKFDKLLLEKTEKIGQTFDIKKQTIADGGYVMRIAFIDAFGVQGKWSEATHVMKDTSPPEIVSLTPENNQRFMGDESYCDVIGTVKDAAMVAVNDELVFLSATGRFTKFINLKPGKNEIHVLARDTQGNETIIRRIVEYTPIASNSH